MLSIIRDIGLFAGDFLKDERSQMTKTGFLSIAATLAVLVVGLLPSMAHANVCGPCSDCSDCPYGDCMYHRQQCSGAPCGSEGTPYHKVCPGVDICVPKSDVPSACQRKL